MKYARIVKRKVWSVEENGELDCGEMLARFAGLTLSRFSGSHFSCVLKNDFEKKKTTVLFSMAEMTNQKNDPL